MATNVSRTTFTNNILAVYNQFSVDGIDIDWEYPGQAGQSGNLATPSDSTNFLAFLKQLKAILPPTAKITAATQSEPFMGVDGTPMTDVSEFATVLDWILLMNYDVWGCTFILFYYISLAVIHMFHGPQHPLHLDPMLLCTTVVKIPRSLKRVPLPDLPPGRMRDSRRIK